MIPVRCFTCGKPISSIWDEYKKRTHTDDPDKVLDDPGKVLDELGIERYCCRRMLLTHVELVDLLAPYQ